MKFKGSSTTGPRDNLMNIDILDENKDEDEARTRTRQGKGPQKQPDEV